MKDYYKDLDEWVEEFNPLMEFDENFNEETGQELFYNASEWDDMKAMAKELIEPYQNGDTKLYQHIWTRVDGDNGKLILLNGVHYVNRLDYVLCQEPWGTGTKEDEKIYIEVVYED